MDEYTQKLANLDWKLNPGYVMIGCFAIALN